jgi:rfaE bifunctional protein nucleotidyltransferase chain/domain
MEPRDTVTRKVLSRERLLALREAARRDGRRVVQCHGCFDIVHPGHVRHLQFAARQGDVLLVSITADAVMNKGDGRPLFPQELRAENLAALDCVAWVHVNDDPTAVDLLDAVRPDVYIKGREYETNRDPRFEAERDAVERHGGRVVFSSGDIVFSSTALVSALEHQSDPFHARLRQMAERGQTDPGRLLPLIDAARGARVVVVGEAVLDTYVLCDRPEVASEGPMMTLRPLERTSYDGGAAIIARHLSAMGAEVRLVTALPDRPEADAMRRRLDAAGVQVHAVHAEGELTEKQRFLVGSQKVMKVDQTAPLTLDAGAQNELVTLAAAAAAWADGAVLADFAQGLFTHRVLAGVTERVRPGVRTLSGDVSGARNSLLKMRTMDLTCPTEHELRAALNDFEDSLNAVVWRYLDRTSTTNAIVTLGADGVIGFDRLPGSGDEGGDAWRSRVRGEHVPALAPHAIDTLGCGDALLATSSLMLLAGGDLTSAAYLGSVAAAVEATRLGNEVVSATDLRAGVRRMHDARMAITPSRIGARLAV